MKTLERRIKKVGCQHMHDGEALVFLVFHLRNHEKAYYDERLSRWTQVRNTALS